MYLEAEIFPLAVQRSEAVIRKLGRCARYPIRPHKHLQPTCKISPEPSYELSHVAVPSQVSAELQALPSRMEKSQETQVRAPQILLLFPGTVLSSIVRENDFELNYRNLSGWIRFAIKSIRASFQSAGTFTCLHPVKPEI